MKKVLTLLAFSTLTVTLLHAQAQPTPSMQEQYDKLHGNTPKKTTTPAKKPEKASTPSKTTTKPQTTQKPAPTKTPAASPSSSGDGALFRVGVRGGVNYCNFTFPNNNSISPESILGYHGGLIFNIGGERFSVQPEVLYSQIGVKSTVAAPGQNIESTLKVNTLTMPVLLKLALGGDAFKFFVNAGGYGSYALSGTTKLTSNGNTLNQKLEFRTNDGRIEYGAVGGAGISLGLGAAQLLVEGRYYYGLGNNGQDIPAATQSFVRNIQGSVGILIPLGGK
ncbi:MAG: PorT family protein [Spirosomaceae bacterium]|jgi:hypothetical protein|nr:PorT family protein [Spirosomataceae bacterium]